MTNSETLEQLASIFYKYCAFGGGATTERELDNAKFAKV